jgi:hypothetical protein
MFGVPVADVVHPGYEKVCGSRHSGSGAVVVVSLDRGEQCGSVDTRFVVGGAVLSEMWCLECGSGVWGARGGRRAPGVRKGMWLVAQWQWLGGCGVVG